MAAINFGYTISKPRAIDIDRNNLRKSDEIPRGINTRGVVMLIKRKLGDF